MSSAAEPRIAAVGSAFPKHYYDQEALLAALRGYWEQRYFNLDRIEQLHRNVLVGGRHLALPIEEYPGLVTFGQSNTAWIRVAEEIGGEAVRAAVARCGLAVTDIDALFFVTVTGIATPSIDARLINRLGLRSDLKRIPIFGLGCVAGAAGIARAADYVRAFPDQVAVLLSVELCSLTLQRQDLSIPNLIASGLFGDGAAAAVVVGGERAQVLPAPGAAILATRSVFYPHSERVMGWDISENGFQIVLSAEVPQVVEAHLRTDVDEFLSGHQLTRADIGSWVCHPGGPKVLEAMESALETPAGALELTWKSLREVGNLSSTSVLLVLEATLAERRPAPGTLGMLLAMGPGFCSELVLLRW
ncbi:MAG: 3-oxoacyl-[acyl-carrier-protein] synthase III C-terminal domain-containing protein [Thermoanaerobaculia bacterium]